jgi:uncharacterized phage-associated protein
MAKCNELKEDNPDYEYNNTKIQKLLYVLYGFYLAEKGRRLTDEQPRLWPYGPVFVNVFNNISENGFYLKNTTEERFIDILEEERKTFDENIELFGKLKAFKLSAWSHEEGSPWSRTKKEFGEAWNVPLKDQYIEEYFKKRL